MLKSRVHTLEDIMDLYRFDKTLYERLTEYTNILKNPEKKVPASQIQSEWECDAEIVMEPVGWEAMWKISRLRCEEFKIHYPTIVIIEVISVHYSILSAEVKIIYVQDDIHLPEKHTVKLIELYPTIKQKIPSLDVYGTANCIDRLRFFYNYLWMPWDEDDDDDLDWIEQHLEARLRLIYDIKRQAINKETCDIVTSLIAEGKKIREKITLLEAVIPDEEEIHDGIVEETCQLMKLHFRLQQIRSEVEVLENPRMREILMKSQTLTETKKNNCERRQTGYFVWLGGTIKEMREASDKIQTIVSKSLFIMLSKNLEEVLYHFEAGDIILLGAGFHSIKDAGGLEKGGEIRGLYNNTFIYPKDAERDEASAFLDFSGEKVLLENIFVNLEELQVGIIVRKGIVQLINCTIGTSAMSTVRLGIVVMPGAQLIMEKTHFIRLGVAVVVCATGEAKMNECTFEFCNEGVQISDKSIFVATKCSFEGLLEHGIRMETRKYLDGTESTLGSYELLNDISEVELNECSFLNNGVDVALKPKNIITLNDSIIN